MKSMKRIIISMLLLLLFCLTARSLFADSMVIGQDEVIDRVLSMAPNTLIAREVLGEVKSNVMTSKGIFDIHLSGDADYTRDEFEKSSTFFGTRQDYANWNLGLSKRLPTGTSTSFNWKNNREQIFDAPVIGGSSIFPTAPTYDASVQFSLTQPLMKNFAGLVDRGIVKQAKKSYEAADLSTQYQIASIARTSLVLYWQWIIAYDLIASYRRAVIDGEHFLKITLERAELGTAERTDVLAAKANLVNRKNGLLRAERRMKMIDKDLKIALGYEADLGLVPEDKAPKYLQSAYNDVDTAIEMALQNRWDYQALKADVERQNIKLMSAGNERWPSLDLNGTLAANGLDSGYSRAMSDVNHPLWSVGVTLSVPLENRAARGEFSKARHEKAKAVIELKKKENDIANEITELFGRLAINEDVLKNAKSVVQMQSEKLKEEMAKYGYGRSNSELVILYQDDLLYADISSLEAWGDYFETMLDLKLAENVLIQ